jgi:hypothetical protein
MIIPDIYLPNNWEFTVQTIIFLASLVNVYMSWHIFQCWQSLLNFKTKCSFLSQFPSPISWDCRMRLMTGNGSPYLTINFLTPKFSVVTYPVFAWLIRWVLDLMIKFIGPLYNWLLQFTNHYLIFCTSSQWLHIMWMTKWEKYECDHELV